jgi:hypothetical protein
MTCWRTGVFAMALGAGCMAAGQAPQPAPRDAAMEREKLAQLLTIRRVFVDRLNGGETAAQMRDMIVSSLERSRLFVITEKEDRADAVLRGSAEDLVFTDTFAMSDGINVHGNASASEYANTRNRNGVSAGLGVGETDSVHRADRKHEASASVRLVSKDGDVIWSTTQESLGGKFRGASADVADKIMRKLAAAYERARRMDAPASPARP